MNIYQHLFLSLPFLCLLGYGLLGKVTTVKLWTAIVGVVGLSWYALFLVVQGLLTVFNFLGSL